MFEVQIYNAGYDDGFWHGLYAAFVISLLVVYFTSSRRPER